MNESIRVASELYKIGAIKIGEFTLKNGSQSPLYIDLRLMISDPLLLQAVANLIWRKGPEYNCSLLCGVPYTALPIATIISLNNNIPMVMRRKEIKDHGTKKRLEGIFSPNQTCLVIEDVMVTGSSIMETCDLLREEGLVVREALVFLDRLCGGCANLKTKGIQVKSVFTLLSLIEALNASSVITPYEYSDLKKRVEESVEDIVL
ncbi:MAG: orotate phosphoribosyltransferase [Victivallaceae bacterium]